MPTVDVPTIGKIASGCVFVVALVSLLTWALTGFALVYPPMSALIAFLAGGLFLISWNIERQWRNPPERP